MSAYDIIFAGGGTAACATAGRLAAADSALRILIIEIGQDVHNDPDIVQPGRYLGNLALAKPTFFQHVAQSNEALGGRNVIVQSGKALGGGSAVNFLMYTRAAKSDFDDWKALGNPGWASNELIPLAQKLESYAPSTTGEGPETHGKSGPIKVSASPFTTRIASDFIDVGEKYDGGKKDHDANAFGECNIYAPWYMYKDPKTGRRSDAAHAYIYPLLTSGKAPNLHILTKHQVVRILFDGTKAVGVEYVDDSKRDVPIQATASRLVVVSAGAIGSPTILERSGIGAMEVLSKAGVEQIVELPGVGENYNDHQLCVTGYVCDTSAADSFDLIYSGDAENDFIKKEIELFEKEGKGQLAHNGIDAGVKYRPKTVDEIAGLGPDFTATWEAKFAHKEDKPVYLIVPGARTVAPRPPEPADAKYFVIGYLTLYPDSIGRVHIASGTNSYEAPVFDPAFMKEKSDVALLRAGYKHSRELARRMKTFRGYNPLVHPPFPAHSEAAIANETSPVGIDAKKIRYSAEDDAIIDAFHRASVASGWHSLGTCAMKPRSDNGVVDSKLNVYGTENLKVADLSVVPDNIGGNTYNTALIIGEKAALIIAEELGISGV